jgi:hypothetical protein
MLHLEERVMFPSGRFLVGNCGSNLSFLHDNTIFTNFENENSSFFYVSLKHPKITGTIQFLITFLR